MKQRQVVFAPEAIDDLVRLRDMIEDRAGSEVSRAWMERLEAWCLGFDLGGERGHLRNDIRPGLRIVGFERRLTAAYTVDRTTVTFLRFFYAGQDWEGRLG